MGSQAAPEPVLFLKPESALCDLRQPIVIPHGLGEVHHEVELAVLIGIPLSQANDDRVARAIAGYGVALISPCATCSANAKSTAIPGRRPRRLMDPAQYPVLFLRANSAMRKTPLLR